MKGWAARHWAGLVASSMGVAAAIGGVYFAVHVPVKESREPVTETALPERRAALAGGGQSFEAPLERLSRTHVGVRGEALVRERGGPPRGSPVLVLLDTGLSIAITTPDAEELLGLGVGTGPSIVGRGIGPTAGELLPLSEAQLLTVAIVAASDAHRVETPVRYLGVDRMEGAQVLLPPHLLAPRHGAVRLDLSRNRLRLCESADSCMDDAGWTQLSDAPCSAYADVVIVSVVVDGAPARLLLDTGGVTLVTRRFYDAHALATRATGARAGELVGSGALVAKGRLAEGNWTLGLGRAPSIPRTLRSWWVIDEPGGAVASCRLDGAVGVDAFAGCAIVIADTSPLSAFLRCETV